MAQDDSTKTTPREPIPFHRPERRQAVPKTVPLTENYHHLVTTMGGVVEDLIRDMVPREVASQRTDLYGQILEDLSRAMVRYLHTEMPKEVAAAMREHIREYHAGGIVS